MHVQVAQHRPVVGHHRRRPVIEVVGVERLRLPCAECPFPPFAGSSAEIALGEARVDDDPARPLPFIDRKSASWRQRGQRVGEHQRVCGNMASDHRRLAVELAACTGTLLALQHDAGL